MYTVLCKLSTYGVILISEMYRLETNLKNFDEGVRHNDIIRVAPQKVLVYVPLRACLSYLIVHNDGKLN